MQTGGVAAAAVLAVTGLVVGFQNAPASASTPTREGAPAAPKTEPVHGVTTMRFHPAKQTVPVQTGRAFTATATTWPAAGSHGSADRPGRRPGGVRSGVPGAGVGCLVPRGAGVAAPDSRDRRRHGRDAGLGAGGSSGARRLPRGRVAGAFYSSQ
jgi:hypothetical protein